MEKYKEELKQQVGKAATAGEVSWNETKEHIRIDGSGRGFTDALGGGDEA